MAVWTFGSARRKTAFRIWCRDITHRLLRLPSEDAESAPEELQEDLALTDRDIHSNRTSEDFWKRIVERRLPPL